MRSLKLAVIISAYNGEKFIREQILSILDQEKSENLQYSLDILIRDDGSNDGTKKIIQQFASSSKNVILITDDLGNLGVKRNFFELLKKSISYDFVFFSDQDDIWVPTKVTEILNEIVNKKMLRSRKPIELYSDASIVDKNKKSMGINMSNQVDWPDENGDITYKFLSFHDHVTGATMLLNRPAVKLILTIPTEFIETSSMHDAFISLVVSTFGEIIRVNKPLILYRQHENNLVGAKNRQSRSIIRRIALASDRINLFVHDGAKVADLIEQDNKLYPILDHRVEKKEYFELFKKLTDKPSFSKKYRIINALKPYIRKKHRLISIAILYVNKF